MQNTSELSIDENWNFFKSKLQQAIDRHVPKKQIKSKRKLSWITTQVKRMIRKRERLYKKARRSKRASHWQSRGSHTKHAKTQLKNVSKSPMKAM